MSNNFGFPQLTSGTSDKPTMFNDIVAALDGALSSVLSLDCSASLSPPASMLNTAARIHGINAPAGGGSVTLPATVRFYLLSVALGGGSVTWTVGSTSVFVRPGSMTVAHCDGTGLTNISAKLSDLLDVDLTTAPTEGQALVYTSGKWRAGTASGGGGGGGGGGVQPSARYWRIANLANGYTYIGAGELQFFDSNGTLIPSSAPFSSGNDTDPLANINDGNLATFWTIQGNVSGYVGLDLGEGATPLSFLVSSRNGNSQCNIAQLNLQYSDDKKVWRTIASYSPTWTGADNETRTFPIPVTV